MKLSTHAMLAAAIAALAFATPARSNDTAPPAQKAAEGNHEKEAKADDKQEPRAATHEPQTHKMVRCNEEAGKKQLRGEERRAFMSACLKG